MSGSRRIGLGIGVLAVSALLAGCDGILGPGQSARRIEALPRPLTASEQEVIARSNAFAFDLLREVYERESRPNVFLSPFSASMLLGMILNGADNATFDAMRAALGFDGLTQDEINRSYRDLASLLLKLDPRVELAIANSTWANQGFPFDASYFDAVTTWFGAEARELDFSNPSTLTTINAWAARHTADRIPKVLDRIDPDLALLLLNAVYFKADWTTRFDAAATGQGPFTLADGATVQVQQMRGRIRGAVSWWFGAGVGVTDQSGSMGVVIGELPYGGQAYVLTVAMPHASATLSDLVGMVDGATWDEWIRSLPAGDYSSREPIHVELPKLELSYDTQLMAALAAMGMGVAFDAGLADFSRMSPRRLFLDFVQQNTFVRMDEKGTEAAAVSTGGVRPVSAPPMLTVNRPYLIAIRERLSGTILFLGAIGDPRSQ